ncbi:MAG: amino acid ABC transporter substrate-binding protein [Atopobiaceae bacterium]|nr:amino acid ABC transporter substrate-binding protein [Atopobiaceae bacterium]
MSNNISRRAFLGGSGLLALALAACGGGDGGSSDAADSGEIVTVTEGTLTVASDLAYPPLESVPEGKGPEEAEGFEVDVVTELGNRLGLEVVYLPPVKFDTIVPMIKQGGKADIGASSFTITDERKQEIDFTDPFMDSNQGVVAAASAGALSVEDLNVAGFKIAVQSGTTGEDWVRENCPDAECVPLDDAIQAMTGCQSGLYNAVVADLPVMRYLCNSSYTDLAVAMEIPTGEQYGIVVSKDNPALTEALNQALADMEADGTMDDLEVKWFGATL